MAFDLDFTLSGETGREGGGWGVELSSMPSIGIGGGESTRTVGMVATDVGGDPVTLDGGVALVLDAVEALDEVAVAFLDVAESLVGVEVVAVSATAGDSWAAAASAARFLVAFAFALFGGALVCLSESLLVSLSASSTTVTFLALVVRFFLGAADPPSPLDDLPLGFRSASLTSGVHSIALSITAKFDPLVIAAIAAGALRLPPPAVPAPPLLRGALLIDVADNFFGNISFAVKGVKITHSTVDNA